MKSTIRQIKGYMELDSNFQANTMMRALYPPQPKEQIIEIESLEDF